MIPTQIIKKINQAKNITVLTGAGVSAESGVPTFRAKDGLWNKFSPSELANMETFLSNPSLVWEWYKWRQKLISEVKPNEGHYALAKMEKFFTDQGKKFNIITQNVDSLHIRSGSKNVYELHGNIMLNKCLKCDYQTRDINYEKLDIPICPNCNNMLRPGVVWFGESLPYYELNKAMEISETSDFFFSIGTSSVVYPAALLPINAKKSGAFVVEINIEASEISEMLDEVIIGKSGDILPKILKKIINQ